MVALLVGVADGDKAPDSATAIASLCSFVSRPYTWCHVLGGGAQASRALILLKAEVRRHVPLLGEYYLETSAQNLSGVSYGYFLNLLQMLTQKGAGFRFCEGDWKVSLREKFDWHRKRRTCLATCTGVTDSCRCFAIKEDKQNPRSSTGAADFGL